MNKLQQRIAGVVDARGTADGARLGRWLMVFQGLVVIATAWWVGDDDPLLGALATALARPLPADRFRAARRAWPDGPDRRHRVLSFLTLWFMFIGVVGRPRSGLKLLAPAVLCWASMQVTFGSQQVVRGFLASLVWVTISDVLALRTLTQRNRTDDLTQQVETDPLTQLPNRRALEGALGRLRAGDVVVVIDIDHFKVLNDRGGHAYGDTVLVDFAHTLATAVRGSDLVARFGGEEFVLVLPQYDGQGLGAASVVARVRGRWGQLHPDITWSAGASCHVDGADPQATLREADQALYRAKAGGRDRVVVSGDFRELVGVATGA